MVLWGKPLRINRAKVRKHLKTLSPRLAPARAAPLNVRKVDASRCPARTGRGSD